MASLDSRSCSICTDDYNATNHKSVILFCSHEFCLTCLVRMKATQSTDCPQCCRTFADFELPILPKMVEDISLEVPTEDTVSQNFCSAKQKSIIGCQAHEKPFVYWCNATKEFYCVKCIVSLSVVASSLELIDDCIPLIHADITSRALAAEEGITSDWEKHKAVREVATQQLEKVKNFREAMQQLEVEFGEFIQDIDSHNANRREQSNLAKKIREMVPEIKSDRDMEMILKSKKSLHELQASTQTPCKPLPVTLLSKIACYYAEADSQEDAFIKKFTLATKSPKDLKPLDIPCAIQPAPNQHHYKSISTDYSTIPDDHFPRLTGWNGVSFIDAFRIRDDDAKGCYNEASASAQMIHHQKPLQNENISKRADPMPGQSKKMTNVDDSCRKSKKILPRSFHENKEDDERSENFIVWKSGSRHRHN